MTRAEAIDACQRALAQYSSDRASFDEVRSTVRAVAHAARADRVTPEQMLVELKSILAEVDALRASDPDEVQTMHARLITVAIRAYYGDGTP